MVDFREEMDESSALERAKTKSNMQNHMIPLFGLSGRTKRVLNYYIVCLGKTLSIFLSICKPIIRAKASLA